MSIASTRWMSRMALVCLPLVLAPPMVTLGQNAVTLPEGITMVAGLGLLVGYGRTPVRFPPFIVGYLLLYCLGWLGSLYNAFNWGIPVGPANVVFLYTPLLSLLAYAIGRSSRYDLGEIATHRYTRTIIIGVGLLATSYPFLSAGVRYVLFRPFINELFVPRLAYPRFPGVGVNANVYSFMTYVLFLFTLHAYLTRKGSLWPPLAGAATIVAAASRTMTVMMVFASLVLLVGSAWRLRARAAWYRAQLAAASRRRILAFAAVIVGLATVAVIYGSQSQQVFTLYARFQDMFGGGEYSGLATRTDVWTIGWNRVKLAPVLGISQDRFRLDPDNPLFFYSPHNEFLYMWTMFGLAGLVAHVYLIGRLVVNNLAGRAELPWFLVYLGLGVQMMVDSAFVGPRVVVFMFVLFGLNMRYLAGRAAEAAQGQGVPDDALPASPLPGGRPLPA